MENDQVIDDLVVSLHYTLRLDDQEVIDSSDNREPLEFLQGHSQIIPGLEQALYGMAVGDEKSVVITPADGYGEIDSDAFEMVERDVFPDDLTLTKGMALKMRDSQSGEVLNALVAEIETEQVLLDFNHPLAGETLNFDVKIAGLRLPTEKELSQGYV
ncbi:MAG: peptidylprolyl isomerase [Anaerolineales bacterium]|nr:peptidylprolyl isomerase [Anaerolineales bacterium]